MSTLPRLSGFVLRRLADLTETRAGRWVARAAVVESFGLHEVMDLPSEARRSVPETPRPLRAGPPAEWEHAGWEPPQPEGHRMPAARLRDAYREGRRSPVEVVDRLEERLEQEAYGECVHSPFVTVDLRRAIAEAEESADRWREGRPRGPLDGIPVPIKDHLAVEGLATGCGTSHRAGERGPDGADAEVVDRLRRAGALVVGKTRTTEWGMQPTGFNATQPMPRNPYDRERGAGGSSTGTGAAVGLGLAPVGLGSDGGGSIRIPSALCGLFGLKPTFQRLSRVGDEWVGTVSHCGPIGQSTTDIVDFLAVTGAAPDPEDPATQPPTDGATGDALVEEWRRALGRGVEGARIGIWPGAFEEVDDALAEPCRRALRALEEDGAELVDVDIPHVDYHETVGPVILGTELRTAILEILETHGEATGDDVRLMMNALGTLSAEEYMRCREVRARLRESVVGAFGEVDLVAAPATGTVAPPYPLDADHEAIYDEAAIQDLCRFSFLANLCGVPAGSIPVGRAEGLPAGLQLMADAWDEASVLAAMAHLERRSVTELAAPSGFEDWRL